MKFSELYRKLEQAGWQLKRTGKHHIYVHPERTETIPVGRHVSQEVPKGTAMAILKKAGVK